MDSTKGQDVIVIGAGIIGISIALKLQSQGRQVLVLDKKGVAAETSAGNAGAFAFADVIPLATPGIMKKAPMWLMDPLGPLSLRPAYAVEDFTLDVTVLARELVRSLSSVSIGSSEFNGLLKSRS